MTIGDHCEEFAGKPVVDFHGDMDLTDPKNTAYALRLEYGEGSMVNLIETFLSKPGADQVEALVIGLWEEAFDQSSQPIVQALVQHKDKLPNLKALFLGDIIYEECEISWIVQSDVSALFAAYPGLELFRVRGGNFLSLGDMSHGNLKELIVEAGGLGADVIQQVGKSRLPSLERLELWLGTEDYGGTSSVDDLTPILSGRLFPRLSHLGLCNAEHADAIAHAVASAPVTSKIQTLDLSMGTMGDEGADALQSLSALANINLSDNYISDDGLKGLRQQGLNVTSYSQGDPNEEWRYCTVSE